MQHPGHGVAPQLQGHVHLISSHQYPISASLDLDSAFRYLIDAPTIVKQHRPVSWAYITPPPDGTTWLEYLPPDQLFPSDGYIWEEPEQVYRQDHRGYTIEMRIHALGYRPGMEHLAQHARTRYHFIAKNPTVPAPAPEPSLWIVHYHPANPNQAMPAAQMPVSQHMAQTMQHRRWLESLGALERREFMLHDREHWPTLSLPNSAHIQQPGYHANPMPPVQMGHGRYPSQPAAQGGAPPNKRPRTQGPSLSGASEPVHDTGIEDEENTALGDFFDHVTQRDISLARYMQHHRWMEEVFSSPYASNQIVPVNLALGLMGELKGLTDGILEPPSVELDPVESSRPQKARESAPFTNLKEEQVDEFRKRVEKHLAEGEAEIQRIKDEHAAKMQDWKKVKTLMQAEKRLRYSTWAGHETALRLEEPHATGQGEEVASREELDDVVKDVERMLNVKITGHAESREVAKGGLQERVQPVYVYDGQEKVDNEEMSADLQQRTQAVTDQSGGHANPTNAASAQQANPSTQGYQQVNQMAGNTSSMPTDHAGSTGQHHANTAGDALDDLPDLKESMLDDMDIDMDPSQLDFGDDDPSTANDVQSGAQATSSLAQPPPGTTSAGSASAQVPSGASSIPLSANQPSALAAAPTNESNISVSANANTATEANADASAQALFPDTTFDDLANLDDAGNGDDPDTDALLDFDASGMGLDESAFGDALHGMDDA